MLPIQTPDSLFHDGNPSTATLGTPVTADWLNAVYAEIMAPAVAIGIPASSSNDNLWQALLQKYSKYALLTGANFIGSVSGPTPTAGDASTKLATTEFVSARIGSAGSVNFRNRIINGNFDFWQRGTTSAPVTSSSYLADRFLAYVLGSTVTPSQQAFPPGQTEVPGEPTFFHRAVVASVAGANNFVTIQQRIENVRTLAGKPVTLSFYAKADSAKNIGVELYQSFGSSGSAQASGLVKQQVALTTAWKRFTVSGVLPTMSGKSISGGNDYLSVVLWLDAGVTSADRSSNIGQQSGTFDIAQVQLEEGSVATPFEQRPAPVELAMCQRYYEKSFRINVAPGVASIGDISTGSGAGVPALYFPGNSTRFAVTKRETPAKTVINHVTGALGSIRSGSVDYPGTALADGGPGSIFVQFSSAQNIPQTQVIYYGWTADAEL
ncbi:hypothetical protein [Jeongeupia chitinilytica]|uniref:Uncharacterized protein n=1 Tax=Jeongeupia chitinilytica TaxID=1041641 RepID=A0ABQ3H0Y0_9NEIS|nr:hypothetical protein [Jeongeupia chitinilytica]GHD63898.1 hypothetical protein GCM10007350_22280 [Jeongeupia chitinilytica]